MRRHAPTSTLIEQDRANHRLRLERLDALPREVAKEVLKQACRELDISDATLIAPCIRKMSKAMLLLPRMERFINGVCGLVFRESGEGGGEKKRRRTMEDVVPILENWASQLATLGATQEFKGLVYGELCRRSVVPSDR